MKTPAASRVEAAAPIVRLLDAPDEAAAASGVEGGRETRPADPDPVARAREFAAPLLAGRSLATGEGVLATPRARPGARRDRRRPELRAAVFLVHAAEQLGKPDEVLTPLFGESQATLVAHARKLGDLQRAAQGARVDAAARALQTERVRKMLLAFSRDLRVVLLRLASRLQTLALVRGEQDAGRARARGRGDAGVRAARQPARHLADQVGARGPRVPLPRPRRTTTRSPASSTSGAPIARRGSSACAPSSRPTSRPTA
jgi:hypothetical protein